MRAHPAGKLGEGATAVTGAELCERLFRSTPPARGATSYACLINCLDGRFQSTPPARGATPDQNPAKGRVGHFNPRPLRGGRLIIQNPLISQTLISIHAPREGGDHGQDTAKHLSS